ncbi:hypothetical protein Naga_100146g7 [Nannochloropsis gaditana]|uniref:Zn(2)-C6 fungal-type domain-containing protein n=1 Tax=Nannochloropsis gaditana TaxID=72520 RepID=W7TX04_9STRA|nr:hypothetical protein Naga_100146g7 [Nannochloropsis gaditana]
MKRKAYKMNALLALCGNSREQDEGRKGTVADGGDIKLQKDSKENGVQEEDERDVDLYKEVKAGLGVFTDARKIREAEEGKGGLRGRETREGATVLSAGKEAALSTMESKKALRASLCEDNQEDKMARGKGKTTYRLAQRGDRPAPRGGTCLECKTSKVKCDKVQPRCTRCARHGFLCIPQTRGQGRPAKWRMYLAEDAAIQKEGDLWNAHSKALLLSAAQARSKEESISASSDPVRPAYLPPSGLPGLTSTTRGTSLPASPPLPASLSPPLSDITGVSSSFRPPHSQFSSSFLTRASGKRQMPPCSEAEDRLVAARSLKCLKNGDASPFPPPHPIVGSTSRPVHPSFPSFATVAGTRGAVDRNNYLGNGMGGYYSHGYPGSTQPNRPYSTPLRDMSLGTTDRVSYVPPNDIFLDPVFPRCPPSAHFSTLQHPCYMGKPVTPPFVPSMGAPPSHPPLHSSWAPALQPGGKFVPVGAPMTISEWLGKGMDGWRQR